MAMNNAKSVGNHDWNNVALGTIYANAPRGAMTYNSTMLGIGG